MILQSKVNELKAYSREHAIEIISEKPINYGVQLRLNKGADKATVNVYSGKKGISIVVGGSDSSLKTALSQFANPSSTQRASSLRESMELSGDDYWAGADEAGKGDYFGPLAVAAVALNSAVAAQLKAVGVRDCKQLSDERVAALAEIVKHSDGTVYSINVLMPWDYNHEYAVLSQTGRNLNDLLAGLHGRTAREVLIAKPDVKRYIVDKFTDDNKLKSWLKVPKHVELVNVTKAESDTAVAAASILARDAFLKGLAQLGREYALTLPKGGGAIATECARDIVRTCGYEVLWHCVKKHFKNSADLQE